MKWLIVLFLTGCASTPPEEEPGEIYNCRVLAQFLICVPERGIA